MIVLKRTLLVGAVFAAASTVQIASAGAIIEEEEHFDVWLQVDTNTNSLFTGSISEDGVPAESFVRVFGAEIGEPPAPAFGSDEPGFQLIDGTLATGYGLTISIVGDLQLWNGGGFSATSTSMDLSWLGNTVNSGSSPAGLDFEVDALGGFHNHFEMLLLGDGGNPADGVYLLPLQISDQSGVLAATETFYFVMNLNMDETAHDAAIDWVEANIIPAPGALTLLLIGGIASRRRRRN